MQRSKTALGYLGLILSLSVPTDGVAAPLDSRGCLGTYYAVEGGASPSGYSLWTFSADGTVTSSSAAEPAVPFTTAQGNWRLTRLSRKVIRIKSITFDFSGPNPDPSYPSVARVESRFVFNSDCGSTVPGASKLSVISCPVSEGPLCADGYAVATDVPVELSRVAK